MITTETSTLIGVAARVRAIVADHFDRSVDSIEDQIRFIEDLEADSLDTMELIMAIEEEFGIEISDASADNVQTVGDAIALAKSATKPPA